MIDYKEVEYRFEVCRDIVNNKNFALLEKADDAILLPIIKHSLRLKYDDSYEYNKALAEIRTYDKRKKRALVYEYVESGGIW